MIYDALLIAAVLFIAGFAFIYVTNFPQRPELMPIFRAYLFAMIAGYFCWFWCQTGQTLAMKTWRIRLTDRDGHLLNARQAMLRFLLALFGLCCGGLTVWWALFDADKQFLHDRLTHSRISVASSIE